jgi:hypothetical protein
VIHQDLPHQPRRDTEEVRASFPRNPLSLDQPDERFVNQCPGLDGMARTLATQVAPGERPKLLVHVGEEPVERRLAAPAPVDQQVGDLPSWMGGHAFVSQGYASPRPLSTG